MYVCMYVYNCILYYTCIYTHVYLAPSKATYFSPSLISVTACISCPSSVHNLLAGRVNSALSVIISKTCVYIYLEYEPTWVWGQAIPVHVDTFIWSNWYHMGTRPSNLCACGFIWRNWYKLHVYPSTLLKIDYIISILTCSQEFIIFLGNNTLTPRNNASPFRKTLKWILMMDEWNSVDTWLLII